MKKKSKLKRFLEAKSTTAIALLILIIPVVVFATIILRDSSQTGEPVVGNRYDNQLEPAITSENLSSIESQLTNEAIIYKKVNLKSSTLRVYAEVDVETSKEAMKELAASVYETIDETLPIETYFSTEGSKKMYDLEVHIYNNVEDRDSEDFVYYEIIKTSSNEERIEEFVTDARNPEYRQDVLDKLEEKLNEENEAETESEDDKGGE